MDQGSKHRNGTSFKKGVSGNPGGRPKVLEDVKLMAREHGKDAFKTVVALLKSTDERVALAAAQEVMNRAYGKPTQYMDVTQRRDVAELSDAELIAIASGSGAGTTATQEGETQPDRVH